MTPTESAILELTGPGPLILRPRPVQRRAIARLVEEGRLITRPMDSGALHVERAGPDEAVTP